MQLINKIPINLSNLKMTMQLNLDICRCMEKAELNVVKQENIGMYGNQQQQINYNEKSPMAVDW